MSEPPNNVFVFAALALSSSVIFSQNLKSKLPLIYPAGIVATGTTHDQARSGR